MPQKCVGYSRELSWSLTRSKTFRDCPRAAWFAYYSQGEPEYAEHVATLKHLVTLPMAAGGAVDYVIARALKAWRDEGRLLKNLPAVGLRLFRRQRADSLAVAGTIAAGGRWRPTPSAWMPPLHHDVYEYDLGRRYEASIEERVAACLATFEHSEIWTRLRRSKVSTWHPLPKLGECAVPSLTVVGGFKVWASVDFAMGDRRGAVVLDWKTGRETPKAVEDARVQLAVYAIWACRHFQLPPERVRVQAVWLQGAARWRPEIVPRGEMEVAVLRTKEEVAAEADLVTAHRSAEGRALRIHASIEGFPPQPSSRGCLACRFRQLCPEGQEACIHM